ncbi:MAG: MarR family winged helix-turn-helix transcriptional regulator [Longimicrobiales bacterium]
MGVVASADSKNSLRVWLYLLKCVKHLEQEMSVRFRTRFGSSLARFDVLAHLDRAGNEGLSTSQLAARLLASKGNITRLLDRMKQDGLISRSDHVHDRRVSTIRLSVRGAELFRRMAPEHETWSHQVLAELTPVEKEELVALLRRVRDRLNDLK